MICYSLFQVSLLELYIKIYSPKEISKEEILKYMKIQSNEFLNKFMIIESTRVFYLLLSYKNYNKIIWVDEEQALNK